jgi:hypothetical protein
MANTTNYNWETPDDTDLVKDGAAAIRTLGNSVDTTTKALNPETTLGDIAYRSATSNTNTRLPIGTAGQILAVSGGVPAWINNDQGDITEVQAGTGISVASGTGPIPVVTNTVATAYDAKGDLIVGTGADTFSRLAVGTNGHTLVADSAQTTGLKWAAPAGGGKVLQVVQATFSTATTVTSTSFTDTGLSVSITPSSATSKVLIYGVQQVFAERNETTVGVGIQLVRTSTAVWISGTGGYESFSLNEASEQITALRGLLPIMYLDTPATTSATTYKIQGRCFSTANSGTSTYQENSSPSVLIAMEIGA